MKVTIIHNNRCTKSRQALQYLEDKGVELSVREYLKEELTAEELKKILKKLKISAEELIRKKEAIFKESYKGKELTEDEWIEAMITHPKLIERPIIIAGRKAVIARPTENIDLLFPE